MPSALWGVIKNVIFQMSYSGQKSSDSAPHPFRGVEDSSDALRSDIQKVVGMVDRARTLDYSWFHPNVLGEITCLSTHMVLAFLRRLTADCRHVEASTSS
jgi:hypothetical protein